MCFLIRGDSNEYIQYTIFNKKKKNALNYLKSAAMGFFSKRLKNKFETAVVNKPSVFEPLKFHCTENSKSKACEQVLGYTPRNVRAYSPECVPIDHSLTVKILKFGTPQTIAIIVLKIEKFDVTLH